MVHPAVHELAGVLALEPVEVDDLLSVWGAHHVDGVVPDLLVINDPLAGRGKSGSLHASAEMVTGVSEEHVERGKVVLSQLLP